MAGLVAVAVVVLVGLVVLDRLTGYDDAAVATEGHHDVCLALALVHDSLLRERVPPPFPTPEQVDAVRAVNADLAEVRATLYELDGIRQLGCREGG